jgi:hypothetical protein
METIGIMTRGEMLAYLAGYIDGEGYIGIRKDVIKGRSKSPIFSERLSVASVNKASIENLREFFSNGAIYFHVAHKDSQRG